MELIATATFGLEAVVRREVEALGYEIIKVEDGFDFYRKRISKQNTINDLT